MFNPKLDIPSDRRHIPLKVAIALYTDPEDVSDAVHRFKAYLQYKNNRNNINQSGGNGQVVTHHAQESGYYLGCNKARVMSAFKEDNKFSGSVSGKITLHRILNRFVDVTRDQGIPKQDGINLLHCCLSGMALEYYYKSIRGIAQHTEEAFRLLEG